jgi:arylsulfatase A-like enzyme
MRVIVVSLNRCRLDYLGAYGAELAVTPHLDKLASEGVVFDQHYVDQLGNGPTRRSWHGGCFGPVPSVEGLAQRLWQAGIATVLAGDERSPSRSTRFAQGWERAMWVRRDRLEAMNQPTLIDGTLQTALDWIETHGEKDNWLVWVEIDALRPPWDPMEYRKEPGEDAAEHHDEGTALEPEEEGDDAEALKDDSEEMTIEPQFDLPAVWLGEEGPACGEIGRWQLAYSGVMMYVDDLIGQFMHLLTELKLMEETYILVTSDGGLAMGEHLQVGEVFPWLHEEVTHLPLILRLPQAEQRGRRVQQLTQPADLAVTVAELFGVPFTLPSHGRSLLGAVKGQTLRRDYLCGRGRKGDMEEWSIRTHQWHFLLPRPSTSHRGPQLYVKPDDRWEINNIVEQHLDIAEHLELTLRRYMDRCWQFPAAEPPPLRKEILQITQ